MAAALEMCHDFSFNIRTRRFVLVYKRGVNRGRDYRAYAFNNIICFVSTTACNVDLEVIVVYAGECANVAVFIFCPIAYRVVCAVIQKAMPIRYGNYVVSLL